MCPTSRLPASVMATIDGVVLYPPRFGTTVGTPFSTMATQEFVVPRSMPITLSIRARLPSPAGGVTSRGLSYPPDHALNVIIMRGELRGRIELSARIEPEAGSRVAGRKGNSVERILRVDLAGALRETGPVVEVAAGLHYGVCRALVGVRVVRAHLAHARPRSRRLGPLAVGLLVAPLLRVGFAEQEVSLHLRAAGLLGEFDIFRCQAGRDAEGVGRSHEIARSERRLGLARELS